MPKVPSITTDEYVAHRGGVCPFCKSENVSGGPVEIDDATAWQEVTCDDCDQEWQDLYALTGYMAE